MAECVASRLCVKLHVQRKPVVERGFSSQTTNFKFFHRKYSGDGCKFVHLPAWKTLDRSTFGATNVKFSTHHQGTPLQCTGLAALADIDSATASGLVTVVDQVLLMASILLTYMAGVIPSTKSYTIHQKIISGKNVASESPGISGSALKNDYQLDSKYILNVVREKILGSLNALEHDTHSGDCILQSLNRPLSLNAVAEGPKLRLLWAAFQQVEDEVNNISSFSGSLVMDDWLSVFSEVIQRSCASICVAWLEKEISLQKSNADKALTSMLLEKLNGDNIIAQNIKRSGKEDLYIELLCYLTFGSLREDCCYPGCFALHGVSILEDLVIALADGIASMYLEFISVDSDVSSETNSLDFSFCTLSTRELQKLRNEVALNQWLCHNMDTVVSMYEDRFDLCTFESKPINLPGNHQNENRSWWKQFTQRKSNAISSELHCIVISHFSMPVKRTKELRALTGWRYYFSLFLELSDITMPLIRAVINKVSDGISFFLVYLIGRSLGLIYTGIRQSLRWK